MGPLTLCLVLGRRNGAAAWTPRGAWSSSVLYHLSRMVGLGVESGVESPLILSRAAVDPLLHAVLTDRVFAMQGQKKVALRAHVQERAAGVREQGSQPTSEPQSQQPPEGQPAYGQQGSQQQDGQADRVDSCLAVVRIELWLPRASLSSLSSVWGLTSGAPAAREVVNGGCPWEPAET